MIDVAMGPIFVYVVPSLLVSSTQASSGTRHTRKQLVRTAYRFDLRDSAE